MSRHSKWHKIKQFKGAIDAKRGAAFTKLGNAIALAAREKGHDPDKNFTLRLAMERARSANMPKDNIERAIKRGSGQGDEGALESILYEGYGPGGVALIIETLSDNRNRTVSEIKHCLSKHNGAFGASGSVSWQFEQKGILRTETAMTEDLQLAFIDAGADDIRAEDGVTEIITPVSGLQKVQQEMQSAGLAVADASIEWIAKQTVPLSAQDGEKLTALTEALEDLDDVHAVYDNAA